MALVHSNKENEITCEGFTVKSLLKNAKVSEISF